MVTVAERRVAVQVADHALIVCQHKVQDVWRLVWPVSRWG